MKDLTGLKFGFLTVLREDGKQENGGILWKCICSCGHLLTRPSSSLIAGRTNSCGCKRGKHRMSGSHEYHVWTDMKQRCRNLKHKSFNDYGGRGIKVCAQWLVFDNFYLDMGACPEGYSLERIDNNAGYSKDNCRWATTLDQSINKRSTQYVEYGGKEYPLSELAKKLGVNYSTLYDRFIRPNRKRHAKTTTTDS